MKKNLKNTSVLLAALLWAILIFSLSSQDAMESTVTSQGFTRTILQFFGKSTSPRAILRLNGLIRDCAHFSLFFVFGMLVHFTLKVFEIKRPFLLSMLVCGVYSILDEVHQIFRPGRAFQYSDLVLDNLGALLGIALVFLVTLKGKKRKFINE